jgi:glycosyltransferase involved in cell wall biosynthesis
MATIESMAMGTPPLVTEVGGGPELVEDGVSGLLLPPRDPEAWSAAAGRLLRDRAQLDGLGSAGRAGAAKFRDETQARAMLEIYDGVPAPR